MDNEQLNDNLETTTEENAEENKETQTSEEEKESFTKEELAEYVKAELEKQKKAEEERKKQEEEDKKLTQKQREERDLKNAQMKLKVDRLNFDISVYRNSLSLQKDDTLDKLLNVQTFVNSETAYEDAKAFIDNYKVAIDAAYNKGKNEAETEFNKLKMQGREVFEGVNGNQKINGQITDFDSFYNSITD